MCKKILSAVLALVLLISLVPVGAVTAFAVSDSGFANSSNTVEWHYNDGQLLFTGSGMIDGVASKTDVPWHAYAGKITNVMFSAGITGIGDNLFLAEDYPLLSNVGVESIESWCGMKIAEKNNPLAKAGNLWRIKLEGNKITGKTQVKDLNISGVTEIKGNVFQGAKLNSVSIGGKVQLIGTYAFQNSTVKKVTIKDVATVGGSAFAGCKSLKEASVTGKVATVNSYAFGDCPQLTTVDFRNNVTSLATGVFSSCDRLSSIQLPAKLTKIGKSAFEYDYALTQIAIPDTVTKIDEYAFYRCNNLQKFVVPKALTTIGQNAFSGCAALSGVYVQNLEKWCGMTMGADSNPLLQAGKLYIKKGSSYEEAKTLKIPNTVFSINDYVFNGCTSINNVYIPSSVGDIGDHTFEGCNAINKVVFTDATRRDLFASKFPGSPKLLPEDGKAENYCGPDLTWRIEGTTLYIEGTGSAVISPMWNDSKYDAARNAVKRVKLPANISSIVPTAFEDSSFPALRDIETEDLAAFAQIDFGGQSLLGSPTTPLALRRNLVIPGHKYVSDLVIPKGVKNISPDAFAYGRFDSVTIPGTVETIGDRAFINCGQLKKLTIGNGVVNIGASAFADCDDLKAVSLPGSVNSIGASAFEGCDKLASVNLAKGVFLMRDKAFANCPKLEKVVLPETLNMIGSDVFSGCTGLKSVVLPAKMKTIPANMFSGCTSLTEITIPETVTKIEAGAFDGCTGLNKVIISNLNAWMNINFEGKNPLEYAHRLFLGDKPVEKVTLLTVTTIKPRIFKGCSTLVTVKIPDTVRYIGEDAFAGCTSLAENGKVVVDEDVWKSIWEAMKPEDLWTTGNGPLVKAYKLSHGSETPDPDLPLLGPTADISEELVEMVANIVKFRPDAHLVSNDPVRYKIGYGTPAKKGDVVTEQQARDLLRDYLKRAAYEVENSSLGTLLDYERDALAAFTFFNGTAWLAGSDLKSIVMAASYQPADFLNTIVRESRSKSSRALQLCLCEANLFMNGKYSSMIPKEYAYVTLDPNGGMSAPAGQIQIYILDDRDTSSLDHEVEAANQLIRADLTPSWRNNEKTFMGWYTKPMGGTKVDFLDATTRGLKLYAQWQGADSGMNGDTIVGKKVSYHLPAYLATVESRLTEDANDRVRVFANPVEATTFADLNAIKHIRLVNATEVVDVAAEYRFPATNHLWVQIRNSGWIDLGVAPEFVVSSGVIKQDAQKIVNVLPSAFESGVLATPHRPDTAAKPIGTLRNGDSVTVFERYKSDKSMTVWGHTSFYNSNANVWQDGWVDLSYVTMGGVINGEHEQEENKLVLKGTGVIVNTDVVNVRKNPRPDATKVATYKYNDKVNIYDHATYIGKKWCLTDKGWVCMDYVSETVVVPSNKPDNSKPRPDTSGNVGTDKNKEILASGNVFNNITLAVRRGPGNNYPRIEGEDLQKGARVHIYQTKMYNGAQWGRVSPDSEHPMWACMSYIKLDGDIELKNPEQPESTPVQLGQGLVYNCATGVNLRASATPHSAFQGVLPVGSTVELLEETVKDDVTWYRTPKGWACGLYVKKMDVPVAPPVTPGTPGTPGTPAVPGTPTAVQNGIVIGSRDVNVRNLPGVFGHAVVTTLRPGASVKIYEDQMVDGATWYKIDQGWIAGMYVQLGNANNGGGIGTTITGGGQYVTGTVLQQGLPILAGAGEGYKQVGKYEYAQTITILEQKMIDNVAYGRTDKGWVNMKQLSMNGTGVTGTGTMATVANCAHSVKVRNAPNGVEIGNIRLGSRVEVLEVSDLGNNVKIGRTPLGWVSMNYLVLDAPIVPPTAPTVPVAPGQPDSNNPGGTGSGSGNGSGSGTDSGSKPDGSKPTPSNQGIPFVMDATIKVSGGTLLRVVPGVMGDYDAVIDENTAVKVIKLDKIGETVWGLVEGGWVNMSDVTLAAWAVPNSAQIMWETASTDNVKTAINKGTRLQILELDMDSSNKVWGKVKYNSEEGWIELTDITKLDNYSNDFLAKGSCAVTPGYLYSTTDLESEKLNFETPLSTGDVVSIHKLEKDTKGELWANVSSGNVTGWVNLSYLTISYKAVVKNTAAVAWKEPDRVNPDTTLLVQNKELTIEEIALNSSNIPMGRFGTLWIELSNLIAE